MGAQNDSSEIMSLGAIILQGVAGVLDTPLKLLNIKSLTIFFPMFPFDPAENIRNRFNVFFNVLSGLKREHWEEKG